MKRLNRDDAPPPGFRSYGGHERRGEAVRDGRTGRIVARLQPDAAQALRSALRANGFRLEKEEMMGRRPERPRRLRWGRLIGAGLLAWVIAYVFGYVYWHFFAFIWGPGPAWAIEVLVWAGLPAAFLLGRFLRLRSGQVWRRTCWGCEERDRTIRLLEDRAAELLRERDHALAGARLSDVSTASQQR